MNNENKDIKEEYPEIQGESRFVYAKQDEILKMLKNGTGVVFFSWNGCPWCHAYINYVNEAAISSNLDVLYYDIYEDRSDNNDFYKEICSLVESYVDEYSYYTNSENKKAYDSSGNVRIYVPMVIYIVKGEIIGLDYEGSMEDNFDTNGEAFFNEEIDGKKRKDLLTENLNNWSITVKEEKDKIDDSGCDEDTACELKSGDN